LAIIGLDHGLKRAEPGWLTLKLLLTEGLRMEPAGLSQPDQDRLARGLTWALVLVSVVGLGMLVIARRGNLGWDDADYLRRGLSDARLTAFAGGPWVLPHALDRLLRERPKPPLLVGWIELGALLLGRSHIDALILHGSVVPFLFVLIATAAGARHFHGDRAGLFGALFVLASPLALSFGGRVMVETFLSLWILLSLFLASLFLTRPTRKVGVALGLATGLALLTKLTAVILLAGALVPFCVRTVRRDADRPARWRALIWACLACCIITAPWYMKNISSAVQFASFSASYNLVAEGRTHITPVADRLALILAQIPGWPLAAVLGVAGCFTSRGWRRIHENRLEGQSGTDAEPFHYCVMTLASVFMATTVLMFPPYFDTRFLLPLWPALVVVLSGGAARAFAGAARKPRLAMGAGLIAACLISAVGLVRSHVTATSWDAAALIDELVSRHSISTLANLGNTESWNVCKTGLINELRKTPGDCFVLHDLSAETIEGLRKRLPRFDALVVLDKSAIPADFLTAAPVLNRAYTQISDQILTGAGMVRASGLPLDGLPLMTVYLRSRNDDRAAESRPLAQGEVSRLGQAAASTIR
jgi:4-amino-4-deoxy-L-arabinose transferase-like glycosyltransferase